VKRLLAAALFVLSATAAWAEPTNDKPLRYMGSIRDTAYFLSNGGAAGDKPGEVWVFAAFETPKEADGQKMVGMWMHQTPDCATRVINVREAVLIQDNFTVSFRKDMKQEAIKAAPGSPAELLLKIVCDGGAPHDGPDAANLSDAVRIAQRKSQV
jgi:hypothetical protein